MNEHPGRGHHLRVHYLRLGIVQGSPSDRKKKTGPVTTPAESLIRLQAIVLISSKSKAEVLNLALEEGGGLGLPG